MDLRMWETWWETIFQVSYFDDGRPNFDELQMSQTSYKFVCWCSAGTWQLGRRKFILRDSIVLFLDKTPKYRSIRCLNI